MVRHGHVNCVACHYNVNGGGILNPYGREISAELLSTWSGGEKERKFLYGLVNTPKWLQLGGDFRVLRIHENRFGATEERLIMMQSDLEGAIVYGKFILDGTIGRLDTGVFPQGDSWISRRHYLDYRPFDEFSFRFGRFFRPYGINIAEHTAAIRRGLGWDASSQEGNESYQLQGSYIGEQFNFMASADLGRFDEPFLGRETGFTTTGAIILGSTHKTGVSYFYGDNAQQRRHVFGPWGILGFSENFFFLAELDFQRRVVKPASGDAKWGFFDYTRLDYEVLQGLHFFLSQDLGRSDFSTASTLTSTFSLGSQWFPRPHLEFQLQYQKVQVKSVSAQYRDWLWLQFHFYI